MKHYFGTDGVRGVANELLTPDFALRLGRAIAQQLLATAPHHPRACLPDATPVAAGQ
jgi:phosphoglucosamine mutase